jgi:hypothetical protein
MSEALSKAPKHGIRHDLESLMWVLVWAVVRHVPGIAYTIDTTTNREPSVILKTLFPEPQTGYLFSEVTRCKMIYRHPKSMIHVPGCKDLETALMALKKALNTMYNFLERQNELVEEIHELQRQITAEPSAISSKLKNFHYAGSVEEVREELDIMRRRLIELRELAPEELKSKVRGNLIKLDGADYSMTEEVIFPSHEWFDGILRKVLNSEDAILETQPYERPGFAGGGRDVITGSSSMAHTGSQIPLNVDFSTSEQTGLGPPIQTGEASATLGPNHAKEASVAAIKKATNKLNKESKSRTSKPKQTQSHARNTSVMSVTSDGSKRSIGDPEQEGSEVEAARSTQSPNAEHGGFLPPPPPTGSSGSSTAPEPLR